MIRRFDAQDLGWVHALNQANQRALSSLSVDAFQDLVGIAHSVWVVEPAAAFLILLDHGAPYDNPNFNWLKARYDRFLYIDRIAVAESARKLGLGRRLYDHAIAIARDEGLSHLVCEVNAEPPNPASDAFHQRLGFGVVGKQYLADRDKTVRYWARPA